MERSETGREVRKVKALALAVILAGLVAGSGTAAAAPSSCGATHGAFANVNGNFGWLGAVGGTPGYHHAVGQQPGATGYNNSTTGCQ
jgi:hypothetical protein